MSTISGVIPKTRAFISGSRDLLLNRTVPPEILHYA